MGVKRSTPEPAGQHVAGGALAELKQCGQGAVDKDQLAFGTRTVGSPPRSQGEYCQAPFVPQRAKEFCYSLNYDNVVIDSSGAIVEMTEVRD